MCYNNITVYTIYRSNRYSVLTPNCTKHTVQCTTYMIIEYILKYIQNFIYYQSQVGFKVLKE